MNTGAPFRRFLTVSGSAEPDLELLQYTALLAGGDGATEVVVVNVTAERVPPSIAPLSRSLLEARGIDKVTFRPLVEPELDVLFDIAAEEGTELIVTRHPRGMRHWRLLIRRLAADAPCSVCFVPRGARVQLRRAMAGINLNRNGHDVLACAAALCNLAKVEELLAVHVYFQETLNQDESAHRKFRDLQWMDMYRFMARADAGKVNCIPLIDESSSSSRAMLRLAGQHRADLIVIGAQGRTGLLPSWSRREAEHLLMTSTVPVINARVAPEEKRSLLNILRRELFSEAEPVFG